MQILSYLTTIYTFVCSQGGCFAGTRRAGKPGSGSVRPGHQHAAVSCSEECQRGGQDEADADQQEHGRRTVGDKLDLC